MIRVTEIARTRTPFGVRLWDAVSDRVVVDGLDVVMRKRLADGSRSPRRVPAFVTRSGVHAFRGLDGLREWEMPLTAVGDDLGQFLDSVPAGDLSFVVEVRDRQARFIDVAFDVDFPSDGLYDVTSGVTDTMAPPGSFYLFPSPGRSAPASVGGVRAQIVDPQGRPLPGAVLRLTVQVAPQTEVRRAGIADARGSVVVLFARPKETMTTAALAAAPLVMAVEVLASAPSAPPTTPQAAELATIAERFGQPPAVIQTPPPPPTIEAGTVHKLESTFASPQLRGRLVVSPN